MIFQRTYNRDFWATLSLGVLMIILVIILAVNFFIAIRNSQINSREVFLDKQTELVSRQLEIQIEKFENDAKRVQSFLDDEDMDPEDFRQELTDVVRSVFNLYPQLIDSVHLDFQDSLVSFEMSDRNNFLRRQIERPKKAFQSDFEVDGFSAFEVDFFLNFPAFTSNFLTDFYLDPDGAKYLIIKDSILYMQAGLRSTPVIIDEEDRGGIFEDYKNGLKGIYEVNWLDSEEEGTAIAAQYPFDFGDIERDAALIYLLKTDDLYSGIYSTYFFLFGVLVLILLGTLLIFTFSLYNNAKARKELEKKNSEISDLFDQQSLLLQELRGFVFFHNYQGKITRVTDEVEKILGRKVKDFQESFTKQSRSEDVNRIRKYILKAVDNKLPYLDFEYDYVRRDGRKIRLRIFESLHYDSSGNFLGGNGICTDITKQFEARNELINSENRLRNVIKNIPDVISVYDNRGTILSLDVKDQNKFVPDSDQFVGQELRDIISKKHRNTIIDAFELSRKSGKIQTVEWPIRIDEAKKYFEVRFFPLDNSRMMSLSKDITAQKVWEKGLLEAMGAAEKANRAKSEFLANMSHEIRTPLNGLLGIIDLLEQTDLSNDQKQYLEIIKNSGNSLLGIIKDILDYSKIEAGKIELNEQVFSPSLELEKLLDIFLGLSQKKKVNLSSKVGDEVKAWFEGDKDKWNQILLNLIGNAIKFTPENGSVFVKLYGEELTESAYFIHCEVQDTGIGIPKEKLPMLTDPFYQVESSSDRTYQGTGLGLAIAKKIIQVMGGDLEIQSKVGQGSTFAFSVLLNKTENQDKLNEALEVQEDLIDTGIGEEYPMRILLAEDNDLNLDLMSLMLNQMKYNFDVARNGLEVLESIKEAEYDLILMDVQMPLMNGLDATKRIREGDVQSEVMIVGLSANVFDEDFKKAISVGMDDYLTKPIRFAELAKKLKQTYKLISPEMANEKRTP